MAGAVAGPLSFRCRDHPHRAERSPVEENRANRVFVGVAGVRPAAPLIAGGRADAGLD
ncbi:hypothetical protein [Dactylosporangium cerinum]